MTEDKNIKDELLMDPFKQADDSDDSLVLEPEKAAAASRPAYSEMLTTYKEQFSEADLKSIREIKDKIEQLDNDALITYGANAQQAMSKFSHQMLNEVESKDVVPIAETLEELMQKLKEIHPDELTNEKKGVFKRLFGRVKRSVNEMISKHQSIASQVDRISIQLEHAKEVLVKDVNM